MNPFVTSPEGEPKTMNVYGLASVAEILDDGIVYRNLVPMDRRLPSFCDLARRVGIDGRRVPRKSEPDYARVMVEVLCAARALDGGSARLQRLIFIGDTRLNDGTAFANLCLAGGWPGLAFIGSETDTSQHLEVLANGDQVTLVANRWAMLTDLDRICREHGMAIDAETAIVLDLDKTTLGARGRNDHVIDAARVAAVRETVASLLGSDFDASRFEADYALFNRTEFHPFTTDNQDYLAYLCLILGSDLVTASDLAEAIRGDRLTHFAGFLEQVEARAAELPDQLRALHAEIYSLVKAGDPTPFKAFRYNEYLATVQRMGHLPPDTPVTRRLAEEIVITQEVRSCALDWRSRGALVFALSDKPDEASVPNKEQMQLGYAPIHRTPTHAIGASDADTSGGPGGRPRCSSDI